MKVSLVIPIKNESGSLLGLLESIENQSCQPEEIILVDGGSTDSTLEMAERFMVKNTKVKLIKTIEASPGKGRNIGTENASNEWIAYTDAGIKLERRWLEKLIEAKHKNSDVDIIYGNYSPIINNYFEKIATLTYVDARDKEGFRGKTIVSFLVKKAVWVAVGGFPDLRAAEDLIFMEKAESKSFKFTFAPDAVACWYLRPTIFSTFRKFVLYSKHNIFAGRQGSWHYGILKQYLLILPFFILTIVHNWLWFVLIILWLFARTYKRIRLHRFEYGLLTAFNPLIFFGVMGLILIIDFATLIGWVLANFESHEKFLNKTEKKVY